ncbi:hypothetical protein ES703_81426 [subsurface metagenome]
MGRTEGLHAELAELAQAALLGTLLAVEVVQVVESGDGGIPVEVVLDIGPDDGRGELRLEGEALATLIGEGIHLLIDDVGLQADAPDEKVGRLKGRRADFLVAIGGHDGVNDPLHEAPEVGLFGKDITNPPDALYRLAHAGLPFQPKAATLAPGGLSPKGTPPGSGGQTGFLPESNQHHRQAVRSCLLVPGEARI